MHIEPEMIGLTFPVFLTVRGEQYFDDVDPNETELLTEGVLEVLEDGLRIANDEPMLLETNYLPCNRFPEFTRQMLENQSLYKVLTNKYSLNIDVAEETFEPILLRPMESQMLHAGQGALGMLIERISYEGG